MTDTRRFGVYIKGEIDQMPYNRNYKRSARAVTILKCSLKLKELKIVMAIALTVPIVIGWTITAFDKRKSGDTLCNSRYDRPFKRTTSPAS